MFWALSLQILLNGQSNSYIQSALDKHSVLENPTQIKYVVTSSHTDHETGITHVYTRQVMNGQPIIGTESSFHYDKKINENHAQINFKEQTQLQMTSEMAFMGELSTKDLLIKIAQNLEIPFHKLSIEILNEDKNNRIAKARLKDIAYGDIPFRGILFFDKSGFLQYGYSVQIELKSSSDWWEILINAKSGEIIDKANYTISCTPTAFTNRSHLERKEFHDDKTLPLTKSAVILQDTHECYLVFPYPLESPYHGPQSLVTNPADTTASPFGWHDTNGAAGPEYTITRGNNVWAKEDQNGDNESTIGFSPDGGDSLVFNNPIDLNNAPSTYEAGAVTNLFYWNNLVHDVMHYYGFDEASGNFQETNYSGDGAGSDFVYADAQDDGNCNANFSTPPDGSNPRMQMYTCNQSNPSRDSDLDNGVVVHEYGHGISNRLTGGSGNSFCLSNTEQMGEGWSDYFAMVFTMEPGDMGADKRGMGNYLVGDPINGDGIRPFPYSIDFNINPQTYDHVKSVSVPHGVGSVWCSMLWEMTWGLIDKYGYDSDLYHGTGGNNIALRLVTEGLKLQPCSPGFVDGRDAILSADTLLNGGSNSCIIWEAFAKRGLGVSADQGSSSSVSDGTQAFDVPPGSPANCQDESDFFVTADPLAQKACDTFRFNLSFYTNTEIQHVVGLTTIGLQDTVDIMFSEISVTVPDQVSLVLIDTIGLPDSKTYSLSVIASNGAEMDTIPLQITTFGSPNAPSQLSPNHDTILSDRPIILNWNDEIESNKYNLQISKDTFFSIIQVDTLLDFSEFNYLNSVGTEKQYWRVRGLNDCKIGPFSAIRTFSHRICGTLFLDPGGEGNYPHNIDTTYVICSDNDTSSILLDFIEYSIFENSPSCQYDYIEIYQGDEVDTLEFIGKYCKEDISELPNGGDIFSTHSSGCVTVKFHSTSVNTSVGWKANITCLDCPFILVDEISVTPESCQNSNDGEIRITVPSMKLDYTFQLIDGEDTTSNTSGEFVNIGASNYDLIIFPTHYPECSDLYVTSVVVAVKEVVDLKIDEGCAFDTSSFLAITFNCGQNGLHSYIMPDSLTSANHVYENLSQGSYQVIIEDTMNNLILFDSTIMIIPFVVDSIDWDTVRMHLTETYSYEGYSSSCPGAGELDTYQNTNRIAINDLDTSMSSILVSSSIVPDFMEIDFRITHTWASDLQIYLQSPSGTIFPLFINSPSCGEDNINVIVSDTASMDHIDYGVICQTSNTGFGNPGPPYSKEGIFKAQSYLNNTYSNSVEGTWTLLVYDGFNLDQGYIEEFGIHFTYNRLTQWFSDPNGQNLIYEGDQIDPFSTILSHNQSDTTQIFESCVLKDCNSNPVPITFMIYSDMEELIQNLSDCEIDKITIDNSNIHNFPNGTKIKVNNNIHSNVTIDSAMNLIFSAGNEIELANGFEIQLNGIFEAQIGPCEDP